MPTHVRQLGKNIRIKPVVFLLATLLVTTVVVAPKASATGLLPKIANVELPLGNTPLQNLLTPATNLTNNLLPVTINPGGNAIGAQVTVPSNTPIIGRPEGQPLVDINIPIRPTQQPSTSSERTTPQPVNSTTITESAEPTSTQTSVPEPANASAHMTSTRTEQQMPSVLGASTSQFGFTLPTALPTGHNWQFATRNYTDKRDYAPAFISLAILLAVIAIIANILYASRNNGFVWSGNSRLAKLSARVDLAQLAILGVSIVGTLAVVVVLLVAKP